MARFDRGDTRRRLLLAIVSVLGLLLVVAVALWQVSRARCFVLVGAVTCRVETSAPLVALTFDDGPTQLGVNQILPELERHSVHATFFLTGREATQRPELVRAIVAAGHEVGNHSFSHVRMAMHSSAFYKDEIMRTDALLRGAGVPAPSLFRPPYGKKLIGLPLALARHHYRMIMWDVEDPLDAETPQAYADSVVREARPGSIILMHIMYSGDAIARAALPLVVRGLAARGLRIVTVGELLRRRG